MRPAEDARDDALAAHREDVPVGRLPERERAGEGTGDDQHLEAVRDADPGELLRRRVEDARVVAVRQAVPRRDRRIVSGGAVLRCDRPDPLVLRVSIGAYHHPRPERVEDAEADAGDVDRVAIIFFGLRDSSA